MSANTKDEALSLITSLIEQYDISTEEIIARTPTIELAVTPKKQSLTMSEIATKIFGLLGGLFILGGVSAYIANFWDTMGSAMRITSTLGAGLGMTGLLVVALREGKYPLFVRPLTFVAAIIETTGWFVLIKEIYPKGDDPKLAMMIVFGIMALQQSLILKFFRRTSLVFTSLFFIYAFLFVALERFGLTDKFIALLLGGSLISVAHALRNSEHRALCGLGYVIGASWFQGGTGIIVREIYSADVAALVVGISLISLSYGLRHEKGSRLSEFGFFIGSSIFYSGLFDIVKHTFFEPFYLGATVLMMYACTVLQSRMLLVTSVLAVLGFIGYYTTEYFVHSIGWPIALILMGVAFFGVSTFAINIKRRYLANS